MKRFLLILTGILSMATLAHAGMFEQGSLGFDADSVQVSVSSTAVTQIMARDSYIYLSYIINPSTFSGVCISSYAATLAVSTTTSPAMLPNSTLSIDGPSVPYWGGMWATMCNALGGAQSQTTKISVIRTK